MYLALSDRGHSSTPIHSNHQSARRGSLIAQPNAAREHRSYTTRWDTIVLSPDDLPAGRLILPGRTPAT